MTVFHGGVRKHWNRFLRFVSLKTGRTLAPPSLVIMHPTHRCNLSCYMCFTQPDILADAGRDERELSGERIKALVSDAWEWGVERIWFAGGGEPLLRRDMADLVRHVKSLGLRGLMSTNGILLDEGFSRLLIEVQWDQVIFSIDAATPQDYRRIRGGDYFGTVKANMKRLSRLKGERSSSKPESIIYSVVLPENYDKLEDIIELGRDVGAGKVVFGNAFPENPASVLTPKQEEEAGVHYRRASDLAEKLGVKTNAGIFLRKREYLENLRCTKPWTQMGVRYDGRVEPCALSKEVMGDASRNTLREVWYSGEYNEIRRKRFNGEFADYCRDCDIYDQHMFSFSNRFYRQPAELIDFLKSESQI